MIFQWIPPNGFHGFRTPKTMSSPQIWCPANRAAGICMLVASLASLVIARLIQDRATNLDPQALVFRIAMTFAVCVLAAVLACFFRLRRM